MARLALTWLLAAAAFAAPARADGPSTAADRFPGAAWQDVDADALPAACREPLDAARARLRTMDTTALMAVHDGRVLFRHGPTARVSLVFSVRKSVLAMLYGTPVVAGVIDLDATLADLGLDDLGGLLPIERQATVRDLLASRSGVYHPAANGGDDAAFAPPRGTQTPGRYFLYNNWDFNAAGTVFEQRTGRGIHQAFAEDFARPLQLEDFDLARHRRSGDPRRSAHLAYPFLLSTRDMARLGLLMLNDGRWRDRQLVPAAWVRQITTEATPAAAMNPPPTARRRFGYGLMWWTLTDRPEAGLRDAFMAWGVHGQYILVSPAHRLVVAHKREVPVDGRWDVGAVTPGDFLAVVTLLTRAAACAA